MCRSLYVFCIDIAFMADGRVGRGGLAPRLLRRRGIGGLLRAGGGSLVRMTWEAATAAGSEWSDLGKLDPTTTN